MTENTGPKKKSKKWIIIVAVAVVVIAAVLIYLFFGPSAESGPKIYVMSVGEITGSGLLTTESRFSGVVESQETKDIKIEQGREVDEIFVEVGDIVAVGDKLFSYTTSDIEQKMRQASIEIEGMRNTINSDRSEIAVLEQEKASAPAEAQLEYTLQIQSLLAGISQTEYSIKTKQVEYDQLKKSYENSVVTAPLAGSIQSINADGSTDPYSGSELPFMVIMKGGDFLIKGTVSEMNVHSLMQGMRVIVRSRINEEQLWGGTIASIDTSQQQESNNSGMYYSGMDSGNSASKYSFYVELDSILGLMIGQHVTIELDLGQGSQNTGLWLSSYYILDLDSNPYVWADNGRDKIEKRHLTLGGYNEELDSYEILEGLTVDDYIAYPEESISAGMATTREFEIPEDPGLVDPGFEDPGMVDPGLMEPGEIDPGVDDGMPEPGGGEDVTTDDGAVIGGADGPAIAIPVG